MQDNSKMEQNPWGCVSSEPLGEPICSAPESWLDIEDGNPNHVPVPSEEEETSLKFKKDFKNHSKKDKKLSKNDLFASDPCVLERGNKIISSPKNKKLSLEDKRGKINAFTGKGKLYPRLDTEKGREFSQVFTKITGVPVKEWAQAFSLAKRDKSPWSGLKKKSLSSTAFHLKKFFDKAKVVVDYGCGDGELINEIVKDKEVFVVYVDIENVVKNPRKNSVFYNLKDFWSVVQTLKYDCVLVNQVLHHVIKTNQDSKSVFETLMVTLSMGLNLDGRIIFRDHQSKESERERLDFVHFIYDFMESNVEASDWSDYWTNNFYHSAKFIEMNKPLNLEVEYKKEDFPNYIVVLKRPLKDMQVKTKYPLKEEEDKSIPSLFFPVQSKLSSDAKVSKRSNKVHTSVQFKPSMCDLSDSRESFSFIESEDFYPQPYKKKIPKWVVKTSSKESSICEKSSDSEISSLDPEGKEKVGLRKLLQNRKVRVANTVDAIRYFSKIEPRSDIILPDAGNNFNNNIKAGCDHPITGAFRELAFLWFLKRVVSDDKKTTLLDWFGSVRNEKFLKHEDLEIVSAPITVIQGDASRQFKRTTLPSYFDTFLVQDVYQEGYDSDRPLSPETLLNLCERSNSGVGYVICRYFPGQMGIDSEEYDEGCWIRENGLILFSPGPTGVGYARHPDVNWLFENRTFEGLSISDKAQFGPFKIFCVMKEPSLGVAIDQKPIKTFSGEVDYVDQINVKSYFSFLQGWVPRDYLPKETNKLLVHLPTFIRKNVMFRSKVLTGVLIDSVRGMVENSLHESFLCSIISKRFPRVYNTLVEETSHAILFVGREEASYNLSKNLISLEYSENLLYSTRVKKPSTLNDCKQVGKLKFWLVLGSLGLTGIYSIRTFKTLAKILVTQIGNLKNFSNFFRKLLFKLKGSLNLKPFSLIEIWSHLYDLLPKNFIVSQYLLSLGIPKHFLYLLRLILSYSQIFGAAYLEEYLRLNFKNFSIFSNWFLETLGKLLLFGCKPAIVNLVFHGLMHYLAGKGVNLILRSVVHWLINLWALSNDGNVFQMNVFSLFPKLFFWFVSLLFGGFSSKNQRERNLKDIIEARKEFRKMEEIENSFELPKGAFIPASTGQVIKRKEIRETSVKTERFLLNNQTIVSDEMKETLVEMSRKDDVDIRKGIHPIVAPLNLMYRPDSSLINLYNAVVSRIIIDPHVNFNKVKIPIAWNLCYEYMKYIYKRNTFDVQMTLEEAVNKMDTIKQKRMFRARDRNEFLGDKIKYTKSISVKHDELIASKVIDGVPNLKPRAIVQYPPEFLELQITLAHSISQKLHEMFNEEVVYSFLNQARESFRISFVFASGYTDLELNKLFMCMLSDPDRVFYIVAGDDTFIQWGTLSKYYGKWCETDFTQYDQTHSESAFKYQQKVKLDMGLDFDYIERNMFACSNKFVVYANFKEMVLLWMFGADWQLGTGLADTTNINSENNIAHGFYQAYKSSEQNDMVENSKDLGYKLKLRICKEPWHATFLKGWWVKTMDDDFKWLPLPSAVLKLGKVLEDPRVITKEQDIEIAMRKCLYALARSIGFIPANYPILGPFVQMMLKHGISCSVEIRRRFKKIEVSYFPAKLDLEIVYDMILNRYGIGKDMIEDFNQLLLEIDYFPTMLNHPVLDLLMFDYE
jgi:SAM-dependent methyltransferase